MCNPDRWTHSYLDNLTTDSLTKEHGMHDAGWWARGWEENGEALVWDEKEGRFFLPSS